MSFVLVLLQETCSLLILGKVSGFNSAQPTSVPWIFWPQWYIEYVGYSSTLKTGLQNWIL